MVARMIRPSCFKPVALVAALLLAALPGQPSGAKVARVKLADLARSADCIVVARVEGMLTFDGLPVARAVPEQRLKGDPGAGPFYFVAGKTWACDISTAVRGETALLFLDRAPSGRIDRKLLRLPAANIPHTPLYRLMNAGRGRMPVAEGGAEPVVTVPYDIELPDSLSAARDPRSSRAMAPRTASLAALVRLLQPGDAPPQPAHLVPTPPQLLLAAGINANGELLIQTYRSVTRLPATREGRPSGSSYKTIVPAGLEGVAIRNGAGQPVSLAEARKRLVRETPVLVMAHGEQPAPAYLRMMAPEVLVFIFPKEAPSFERARWPVEKPAGELIDRRP